MRYKRRSSKFRKTFSIELYTYFQFFQRNEVGEEVAMMLKKSGVIPIIALLLFVLFIEGSQEFSIVTNSSEQSRLILSVLLFYEI